MKKVKMVADTKMILFETRLNILLQEGWELQGNMILDHEEEEVWYIQMLSKTDLPVA